MSRSYLSAQDAVQCHNVCVKAGCDVLRQRASPWTLRCGRGWGRARARGSCVRSGGAGKSLTPSLLSFYNAFVKVVMRKIMKHLHTFASLSVSHCAQIHAFVPEFPGVFNRERIFICRRQRLLRCSLDRVSHLDSSVAKQRERRGCGGF